MLYDSGLLDTRKAYYCPGIDKHEPYHGELGAFNYWPPEAGNETRASYIIRPEFRYPTEVGLKSMPMLSKFGATRSVNSCLVDLVESVDKGHRTGINVGYGDGHVAWVGRALFNDNLSQLTWRSSSRNPVMDAVFVDFDNATKD